MYPSPSDWGKEMARSLLAHALEKLRQTKSDGLKKDVLLTGEMHWMLLSVANSIPSLALISQRQCPS